MPQTAARSPETASRLGSGPVAAPARGAARQRVGRPLGEGLGLGALLPGPGLPHHHPLVIPCSRRQPL